MLRYLYGAAAVTAAALGWLTLGGAVWPAWLQLAACVSLAAFAVSAFLGEVEGRTARDRREWLAGYWAALVDLDPGAATAAAAVVGDELAPRRWQRKVTGRPARAPEAGRPN